MNKDSLNERDVDRIIKLVEEYTNRLKDLINLNQLQRKNSLTFMFTTVIAFIIVYAFGFIYFQYDFESSNINMYFIFFGVLCIVIFYTYFFLYYYRSKRNNRDLKDEAILIKKQLVQLVKLASQTREHMIHYSDNLAILEIDLKLTEAEDLVERANRHFFFSKEENTNANRVDGREP